MGEVVSVGCLCGCCSLVQVSLLCSNTLGWPLLNAKHGTPFNNCGAVLCAAATVPLTLLCCLQLYRMPSSNSRTSTKSSDALNPALWDCTMVAVCEELQLSPKRRKELVNNAAAIREAYTQLLGDERFKKMLQTTSRANVMGRIREMQLMLQRVAPER